MVGKIAAHACLLLLAGGCGAFTSNDDGAQDVVVVGIEAPPFIGLAGEQRDRTRPAPSGRFTVHLTGQTVADDGLQAFALDGVLDITSFHNDDGLPVVEVALRTENSARSTLAPAGSIELHRVFRNDERTLVLFVGNELIIEAGALDASAGRFKSAQAGTSGFDIGAVRMSIRLSDSRAVGTMELSSQRVRAAALDLGAEYEAQFSETR